MIVLSVLVLAQILYGYFYTAPAIVPVTVGDSLVFARGSASGENMRASLTNARGCLGLIFFRSTCPACQRVAPTYSDVKEIAVESINMPIIWVGVADDDGRAIFAEDHRLPTVLTVSTREFLNAGVDRIPLLYILSSDLTIMAITHPRKEVVATVAKDTAVQRACTATD